MEERAPQDAQCKVFGAFLIPDLCGWAIGID